MTPHQGHLPKVNFNQNLLYQNPPLGKQKLAILLENERNHQMNRGRCHSQNNKGRQNEN